MSRLSRLLLGVLLVGCAWLPLSGMADEPLKDEGSHIQVNARKDGDTVGSTFDLKYDLHAGSEAHHAHGYLDGQYQKGFKGTFADVAPGKHDIKVQAANKDHTLLQVSAVVHVEVK